ncbi:hypothetical protein CAEBREN_08600 [Caenorhabditis brenneri]|uniref:BTB domain-containing protein n=1 Tax=Caenorhabditis brenneri TaxID=135651 RepID=G0NC81_CAEBE|nr:hypothetical protein CAEBREN_08600 [Caenorhabditis brenneri]
MSNEQLVLTYQSELVTVNNKKRGEDYPERLNDSVECTYNVKRSSTSIKNSWKFYLDEQILARLISFKGTVALYQTDIAGNKQLGAQSEMRYPEPTSIDIYYHHPEAWRTKQMSYELKVILELSPPYNPVTDAAFEKSEQNDTALEIEGQILFVNEELLYSNSDYFRHIFTEIYTDGMIAPIPIGLCTLNEFKFFMCTFYDIVENGIKDHQIVKILEMATRFQFSNLLSRICNHLTSESKIDKVKILWFMEKYRLSITIPDVMGQTPMSYLDTMCFRKFFAELSQETHMSILINYHQQMECTDAVNWDMDDI